MRYTQSNPNHRKPDEKWFSGIEAGYNRKLYSELKGCSRYYLRRPNFSMSAR